MNRKSQGKTPTPRVARRRAETRRRVLVEAARLFAELGIDGVTLTDVADAADISRGTLYSHFGSKEELVHATFEPMLTFVADQARKLSQLAPSEAIEGILRIHLAMWREFPGALSVAYQVQGTITEEHRPAHHAHPNDAMTIFQRAADAGILRVEPELAIKILNTFCVPFLKLCQEAPDPEELFVKSMLRLLLN